MAELWLSMDIEDKMVQDELAYYQTLMKNKTNGDWEDPTSFHISIDCLSDDESEADKVVYAMKMLEQNIDCYNQYLFASGVNRFDMGALWIGVDDSLKLYQIRYALHDLLLKANFQRKEDKFKSFIPHITMAYNVPKNIDLDIKIPRIAIPLSNITLWNSFKANGTYVENYLYKIKLRK